MYINGDVLKKDYFYLSGAIAIGFYIFCFILFALYLNAPEVKKFDAISKNTVLELDIMILDTKEISQRNKTDIKDTQKSHEVVKKSASRSAKQNNNVKSLFANVKTNTKTVIEQEVNNVTKSTVASRFKSKFEKQRKSSDTSVSKLLDNVKTKAKIKPSTDSKYNNDPYFSKIYELLYSRWNPMLILEGLSAKVLVSISKNGTFSYRLMKRSGDERFDSSLREFLESQKSIKYPVHQRTSKSIEVIFGSEG
jgi:hypothetical protein